MTDTSTTDTSTTVAELTVAAASGDTGAWAELVDRTHRVVWKAVNMMTSDAEIRADAFAATWLRLAERIGTIREPEKLPGWLTTTATNEVRRLHREQRRNEIHLDPSAPSFLFADLLADADVDEHDAAMVRAEANRAVRRAFRSLDEECRELLTVLVLAEPAVSYKEASSRLARPVGALGPARRRCLDKLRSRLSNAEGTGR